MNNDYIYKLILAIILLLIILPIFMVFYTSVWYHGGSTNMQEAELSFKAYLMIFSKQDLLDSFVNSFFLSFFVALLSTFLAFILGLNFWNKSRMLMITFLVFILYFTPSEVHSLAILKIYKLLGGEGSSTVLLFYSLVTYTLPYALAIITLGNLQINSNTLHAAADLGGSKLKIIYLVIFKMTTKTIISAFLVSLLLSLNEYTRASYFAGTTKYFSKYIYGALQSGANEVMYALSTVLILFIVIPMIVMYLFRQSPSS